MRRARGRRPAAAHPPALGWLAALLGMLLITACGSRGPGLSPLAEDAVILAFGDSLTFGTGAQPAAAYPARLAARSGRRVVNAGVPGELSAAGLARLPAVLADIRPALVLLCHGGNDLLRKHDTTRTREHLAAMIELVRDSGAEVLLIGVPSPGLFLRSAALYADVAQATATPLAADSLARILGQATVKADPVHPNAAG